ncbi:pur operon repressor [Hutsoniella sourekii]|uniref:pur operon repressor n=1 Tax=Hutsoniella sourekii TaxID=87650 RepID=UPI0004B39D5C|nr:pur operon repressor [Hutsoniella sourekii]
MDRKFKRNERLLFIMSYLLQRPNQLINYQIFIDYLNAAKSSLSEDITMIDQLMIEQGYGHLERRVGASGGVIYRPGISELELKEFIESVQAEITQRKRILPGNYIALEKIIDDPKRVDQAARIISQAYESQAIDYVLTIEMKGVPLSTLVAKYLNTPQVIARRSATNTSGPMIGVNYVAGSRQTVSRMELPKDSLEAGSRVLIVDDFLRNGGTIRGMVSLLEEFDSHPVGICVFAENSGPKAKDLPHYQSLFDVALVYDEESSSYQIQCQPGTMLEELK